MLKAAAEGIKLHELVEEAAKDWATSTAMKKEFMARTEEEFPVYQWFNTDYDWEASPEEWDIKEDYWEACESVEHIPQGICARVARKLDVVMSNTFHKVFDHAMDLYVYDAYRKQVSRLG